MRVRYEMAEKRVLESLKQTILAPVEEYYGNRPLHVTRLDMPSSIDLNKFLEGDLSARSWEDIFRLLGRRMGTTDASERRLL